MVQTAGACVRRQRRTVLLVQRLHLVRGELCRLQRLPLERLQLHLYDTRGEQFCLRQFSSARLNGQT